MNPEEMQKVMLAIKYLKNRGSFLISFAECWFSADKDNRLLLLPVAEELYKKYRLHVDLEIAIERGYFN